MVIKSYQNIAEVIFSFIAMVFYSMTVWLATVEFFFGGNKNSIVSSYLYIIPLILVVINFLEENSLKKLKSEESNKKKFILVAEPLFCFLYLVLKISHLEISQSYCWLILEFPILYYLYIKASKLYYGFKVMSLSKKYEYYLWTKITG